MDEREREKIFKFKITIEINYSRETTRCFLWLCISFEFDFYAQILIDIIFKINSSVTFLFSRKDFIIYQEPNASPSRVTENGFSDKVKKK